MQLQLILQALFFALVASAPNPQSGPVPSSQFRTDVTDKKPCTPNILLYSRGTGERGNIGGPIGQSFINATEAAAPGRFLYQGIDFVVPIPAHLDMSVVVKRQLKDAVTLCPNARIFLGGYSFGAQLLHPAVDTTDVDKSKIGGIVTFGDPSNKQPFVGIDASKVKVFCAAGDDICASRFGRMTAAHILYFRGDTTAGAQFVAGLAA